MSTHTKATVGAIVLAVGGALIALYVPAGEARTQVLAAFGLAVGWLGFGKPGTVKAEP